MYNDWTDNYPLFKECVDALNANSLPSFESDKMSQVLMQMAPIASWGKIDWNKINKKIFVSYDLEGIIPALERLLQRPFDPSVYIAWSSGSFPIITTNLEAIVKNFDDVACVAPEKFIFNPTEGYLIEINDSNEITVGLVSEDVLHQAQLWYTCLTELGDTTKIYMRDTFIKILHVLKNRFGFGPNTVAWNLIDEKICVSSKNEIISNIEKLQNKALDDRTVYIIWDQTTLPIIKTTIDQTVSNFDIIKKMGAKIWIVDTSWSYIIELTDTTITIGLPPERKSK